MHSRDDGWSGHKRLQGRMVVLCGICRSLSVSLDQGYLCATGQSNATVYQGSRSGERARGESFATPPPFLCCDSRFNPSHLRSDMEHTTLHWS